MAAIRSTLSISYDITTLEVVITGLIAIRTPEIAVTIVGGAEIADNSPVLKIQEMGNNGATTPIMNLSTWSTSGDDIIGTLNSNTTEAIAAFADAGNTEERQFNVLLITTGNGDPQFNGVMRVKNNPSACDEDPVTLEQSEELQDKLGYSDFASVTDLADGASWGAIATKVNEIAAILRGD